MSKIFQNDRLGGIAAKRNELEPAICYRYWLFSPNPFFWIYRDPIYTAISDSRWYAPLPKGLYLLLNAVDQDNWILLKKAGNVFVGGKNNDSA